jgi:hypothetical protein
MEVQWSTCAGYKKSDYFFGVSLLPIYFVLSGMRFLVVDFGSICIEIEGVRGKKTGGNVDFGIGRKYQFSSISESHAGTLCSL